MALVLALAILGLTLLAGDESPFEAVAPRGSEGSKSQAPRVTFDDGPTGPPPTLAATQQKPTTLPAAPGAPADKSPEAAAAKDERPALLQGVVVDRTGAGVPDATVRVLRMRRRQRPDSKEVKTDARGGFTLETAPGQYWITAEREGLAKSEGLSLRLTPAESKTDVRLLLPPSSALAGTVLTPDGRPLAGARVSLGRRNDGREAETDAEGSFLIDGLREGLYRVRASHDGYVTATARDVPVVEGSGGQVTLTLEIGGELSGVLRQPDGAPLKRGLVFAHRERGRPAMTRSDEAGRFRLAGLEPGPLTVFARSEDYGLSVRTPLEISAGSVLVHDLVLAEGPRVEGTLRTASGEPLAEAHVVAQSQVGDVTRRGTSDAKGRYMIKNLYPGRYTIRVASDRRSSRAPLATAEVEVTRGTATLDLSVPEPVSLAGVVRDDTGTPVKNANVFAIVGSDYRGQARSKDDGTFQFRELPANSYRLFVRVGDDRLVGLGAATLREGEALEDLELIVRPPAKLRGRVLDGRGQPVVGVVLSVRGGGESPVRREATTDGSGHFELGPLYDGAYELEAEEGSLALVARRRQVEELSLDPIRFVIQQGQDVRHDLVVR